jgi:hypothetical protein
MRNPTRRAALVLVTSLLLSVSSLSQTVQSLDGVRVTLSISGAREFQVGERIPLDLTFTSAIPDRYGLDMAHYDRSGRMNSESFDLEPREGWSDPLSDYYNSGLFDFMGGGLRGIPKLGSEPITLHLDLNEWVRFERPGHYRLVVKSNRVIVGRDEKKHTMGEHAQVASNSVEFDILRPSSDWIGQQVATAIANLRSEDDDKRREAARSLRFLGTNAAVDAMVERVRGEENGFDGEFEFGLIGAPDRKYVVAAMHQQLLNTSQPITSSFIQTLAVLSYLSEHPQNFASVPSSKYDVEAPEWKSWLAEQKQRRRECDDYVLRYLSELAGTLPHRQGRAYGEALTTLLVEGASARMFEHPEFGGFVDNLRTEMPKVFMHLPESVQQSLLSFWWSHIRSPEMLPVVRAMYERKSPFNDDYLYLIADLDPKLAREMVLQDMRKREPSVLYDQVHLLDSELLPEMDDLFASRLEDSARQGSPALRAFAILTQRHATARIAKRVEAVYSNLGKVDPTIRAHLIGYLLRADFTFGKTAIEKEAVVSPQGENWALQGLGYALERRLQNVEQFAFETLASKNPREAMAAAEALQSSGPAASEKQLWNALRSWYMQWDGKADELGRPNNAAELRLGTVLIDAIAKGDAWLTDGEKLAELRKLCVTREQCATIEGYHQKWVKTPKVEIIVFNHKEIWPHFAQYEMGSLNALKRKLKQFSPGSTLTCELSNGASGNLEAVRVRSEMQQFASENGLVLTFEQQQ